MHYRCKPCCPITTHHLRPLAQTLRIGSEALEGEGEDARSRGAGRSEVHSHRLRLGQNVVQATEQYRSHRIEAALAFPDLFRRPAF